MIRRHLPIALIALLLTAGLASADPPPPHQPPHHREPRKLVTVAYMGVSTSTVASVGETLRAQLDLPRGVGLIVGFVDPQSPAASAKLQQHDILFKLGDQYLINMHQMQVLVRMHKPGDEVQLTVIRAGKRVPVKVKLGSTQVHPADVFPPFRMAPDGRPFEMDIDLELGPDFEQVRRAMRRVMSDDDHTITVEMTDEGPKLTIQDDDGETIIDGRFGEVMQWLREHEPELIRKVERLMHLPPRHDRRPEVREEHHQRRIHELEKQLNELREVRERLLDRATPEHPRMRDIDRRIDDIERQLEQERRRHREREEDEDDDDDEDEEEEEEEARDDWQSPRVFTFVDDDHRITILRRGERRHVVIQDNRGRLIYRGVPDGEAWDDLPENVRNKCRRLMRRDADEARDEDHPRRGDREEEERDHADDEDREHSHDEAEDEDEDDERERERD